jgi:hypothetical protein
MSQSQLKKSHTNTNRQDNVVMDQLQVLGMIPLSTRGSTRKEAKEPIKLGKILRTDWTVRLSAADYPPGKARTIRKIGANGLPYEKMLPAEKHRFCLNGPQNGPRPLADCLPAAECPPNTRGRSLNELRRKMRTRKNTSPKSSPDLPNG